MAKGQSAIIPANIGVRFRGRRCSGAASATVPMFYTKTFALSEISQTFEGHPGTKWFHDTALALFAGGGTVPTNKTALDILANQIAIDYVNWLLDSFDEVYPQVISPILDALTDVISWEYRPKHCITRRHATPYNNEPEELMHHDPANSACVDSAGVVVDQTPCIYFYGPPGTCVSGKPNLTRYKVCLIDGILTQKFISTDIVT